MTFIVAGTALATTVGLTGLVGATAGAAIGTGVVAGAAGAGLGATGAAITGGDIGQGALIGGIGGMVGGAAGPLLGAAGVGGATMGGNIAAGGIAGAAGGAAGSAAGGEDIGKGALMGGAMGGIGGAMKGVAPTAEQAAADAATATGGAKLGDPNTVGAMMDNRGGLGNIANPNTGGVSMEGVAPVSYLTKDYGGLSSFNTAPTTSTNAAQGLANVNSNPVYGGGKIAEAATTSSTSPFQSGMNAVGDLKGMDVAKAVAPGLISGAVNGGGYDAAEPYKKPKSSIGGASLSKDFKPYWADSSQYYAEGGTVDSMQAPQPMNKFYEQGLQMAQQAAQQQQQQQQQQQATPAAAPQGIAQAAPQAAPVQAAANGGMMHDNLGGYSHGGIAGLTRGPGDGVSDSIPAQIGNSGKQPARLADGEFVIPSRIVSELGNGSTEAGAKALQAMVNKIQAGRKKSTGKGKVAVDSKARKELLG